MQNTHLEGIASGTINLSQSIPMYSLPLLENVFLTLCLNEETTTGREIGTNISSKQLIYSRLYPFKLSDPDTPLNDAWTQMWIQEIEASMIFQEESNLSVIQILSTRNDLKSCFSTHAVLEKMPGNLKM
jgi:hypothetical protein